MPTEEVLTLLGRIATAQPMNSYSMEAEHLLKKMGYPQYTRTCVLCHTIPAFPKEKGAEPTCTRCQEEDARAWKMIKETLNV